MEFSLPKSLEVLENTPEVLSAMLNNLSPEWTTANEGENTWSVKEVVAHLVICERTNWIMRARLILSDRPDKTLVPIDMVSQAELSRKFTLTELLKDFQQLRLASMKELKDYRIGEADLVKTAIHPKLGEVNLQQLIATWVTHDLSHIIQIARIMAKQNKQNVGAFAEFLKVLN